MTFLFTEESLKREREIEREIEREHRKILRIQVHSKKRRDDKRIRYAGEDVIMKGHGVNPNVKV